MVEIQTIVLSILGSSATTAGISYLVNRKKLRIDVAEKVDEVASRIIARLEGEIAILQEKVKKLEDRKQEGDRINGELMDHVKSLERENKALSKLLGQYKKENELLKKKQTGLKKELDDLKKRIGDV